MSIPSGYKPEQKKKKKKSGILNLILIGFIALIIIGVGSYIYLRTWYSRGINEKNEAVTEIVTVEIPEGTSTTEIGEILIDEGLIDDINLWNLYARFNNPVFLAAKYKVPANLSLAEIADLLQKEPEVDTVWVTFPEGRTRRQYVELLQGVQDDFEGEFTATKFDDITEFPDKYEFNDNIQSFLDTNKPQGATLEGFLYPETYAFEPDASAQDVVEIMVGQMISEISELDFSSSQRTFFETLTLASIVEKESLGEEDRPRVASVFDNRLEINMKLQSDATVNYATGKSERRPTYDDISISSPYNTYVNTGLPPGPINNPRLDSIRVSLNPPETNYYFFIHEEDGTPHFGETEDDHFFNVCRYLDKTC